MVAVAIVLVSAGTTVFLLTRPASDDALYEKGKNQLATGRYAFALKRWKKQQQKILKTPECFCCWLALMLVPIKSTKPGNASIKHSNLVPV